MQNQTILIPSTKDDNSLTNFSQQESTYDDFRNKSMNFVRNRVKKTHIPYYDEDINHFLIAASPLFKQLTLVQGNYDVGSINDVRQAFIDNINNYSQTIAQYDIEESQILVSRYILCTFIDELINTTFFGRENDWSSNSLLSIFHNESYGGENFFRLLDKFLKAPAKYIYILELMYVCISLGFEGRYRVNTTNKHELTIIKDSLYKQIKIIQGREPLKFYTKHNASTMKHRLFYMVSYPSIILSTCLLLSIIYIGLTYSLSKESTKFTDMIAAKHGKLSYLNKDNFNLEDYQKDSNE